MSHYQETQFAFRNLFALGFFSILLAALQLLPRMIHPANGEQLPSEALLIIDSLSILTILCIALCFVLHLKIKSTSTELRVWFPPFPGWNIRFDSIQRVEALHYSNPFIMGGWGYRIVPGSAHGHVMNMYGKNYVRITLKNGKVRTIGTQHPHELAEFLLESSSLDQCKDN